MVVQDANLNPVRYREFVASNEERPAAVVTYATKINGQRAVIRFDRNPSYWQDENIWVVMMQIDMTRQKKKELRQKADVRLDNSERKGTGRSGITFLLWAIEKMDEFQQTHPNSWLCLQGSDDRRTRAYAALQRYGFVPASIPGYYIRTSEDFTNWQKTKQIRQSPTEWTIRCPYSKEKLIPILGKEYVNTQMAAQEQRAKKVKNTIPLSEHEFWSKWYNAIDNTDTRSFHRDASITAFTNLWWRTFTLRPSEDERAKAFPSADQYDDFVWNFRWYLSYIADSNNKTNAASNSLSEDYYLYSRFLCIISADDTVKVKLALISLTHGKPPANLVGIIDLATITDEESISRILTHIDWGTLNRSAHAYKIQQRKLQ